MGEGTLTVSAPAAFSRPVLLAFTANEKSAPLPYDATASQLEAALTALPGGAGNLQVSGGPGASAPFEVEFTGALGDYDVREMRPDPEGLTPPGATASVRTERNGYDGVIRGYEVIALDVCGKSGDIYIGNRNSGNLGPNGGIDVLSPGGGEILAVINGAGSPQGVFPKASRANIAVIQSNCHAFIDQFPERRTVEEYEPSGAFVAEIEKSSAFPESLISNDVAVDNGPHSPSQGNFYVARFDDFAAFGPLSYPEPPLAVTGEASGVGEGAATLNGTVDPRGLEVTECRFDYVSQAGFAREGFRGARSVPCAESPAAIGQGSGPVPVHADLAGLAAGGRYRFRLVAANGIGASYGEGEDLVLPPPPGPPTPSSPPAFSGPPAGNRDSSSTAGHGAYHRHCGKGSRRVVRHGNARCMRKRRTETTAAIADPSA